MKNNEMVQQNAVVTVQTEPDKVVIEMSAVSRLGENMRRLLVVSSFAGLGLFAASCATGYVKTEPAYVEYSRPVQPSNQHVWIGDGYQYNRHSQVYVQRNGYWAKPERNRTYVPGHWQSTPNGHYWVEGKWHRNR